VIQERKILIVMLLNILIIKSEILLFQLFTCTSTCIRQRMDYNNFIVVMKLLLVCVCDRLHTVGNSDYPYWPCRRINERIYFLQLSAIVTSLLLDESLNSLNFMLHVCKFKPLVGYSVGFNTLVVLHINHIAGF